MLLSFYAYRKATCPTRNGDKRDNLINQVTDTCTIASVAKLGDLEPASLQDFGPIDCRSVCWSVCVSI